MSQTAIETSNTSVAAKPSARVLLINGSPSKTSKSGVILKVLGESLQAKKVEVDSVSVLDFSAEDLLFGNFESLQVKAFAAKIAAAPVIVIATPIYKASYTGVLKALLDLAPQESFNGKAVLALATAGSLAHFLALDYSLKPVLSYLGAETFLSNIYFTDKHLSHRDGKLVFDEEAQERLNKAIQEVEGELRKEGLLTR